MNSLAAAGLIAFLTGQPPADPKAVDDVAKLQGTWTFSTLEIDGKAIPAEVLGRSRLDIHGARFTQTDGSETYRGTFKLDVSRSPKTIDLTITEGPEKGTTALGIYEIHGDEWKLCLTLGKQARPTAFATKAGSGHVLETLKRQPPPSPEELAKVELAKFEGEWLMTSGQADGQPMPDSARSQFRRIVKADETLVMNGNLVYLRAKSTLDPRKKPKTIDYTLLEGSNKGMKQLGIYEWVDDSLRICFAAPGKDRPTDFSARAGSGHTVSVWKRAK